MIQRAEALKIALVSIFAGLLLSTFWSAELVDSDIGDPIANTLLGFDAKETPIANVFIGALFAFVTGIAGTFTACNICAFSAVAPLAAHKRDARTIAKPILTLSLGLIVVAALYGGIGALIGPDLPQLSNARLGGTEDGIRLRSLQSLVVFCTLGLIYIAWGLIVLGIFRNPFAKLTKRFPWVASFFMGATIGAFLIGRPFGLFRKMFEYAASTHNPFYGSLSFILQGLGNIILVIALFLLLMYGTRGWFERWITGKRDRLQKVTAVALIISGTFFFTYWGPRLLARNDLFVWPYFDWETHTIELSRD